jgi:hypothetical protein
MQPPAMLVYVEDPTLMSANSRGWLLVLSLAVLAVATEARAQSVVPLQQAHSHNDYEQKRPLHDALARGFCSVEADVFLRKDKLLIGHFPIGLRPERNLEALYLDPLRARVRANRGRVYPDGPTVFLLIDVKTEARETCKALATILARYEDILTLVRDGRVEKKAITVVVSGNCDRKEIASHKVRLAAIDGRPGDLDSTEPAHLIPWISARWGSLFDWRGKGPMPKEERAKLRDFVARAHRRGRLVRFWATPENPAVWRELLAAGVDLINTDCLDDLRKFLLDRQPGQAKP